MPTTRPRATSILAAVFALTIGSACSGSADKASGPEAPRIARVVVTSPRAESDAVGDTIRFAAQALDAAGQVVPGAEITWSVSAPSVAEINASGLLTTRGNGPTEVRARSGDVIGTGSIQVTQRVAAIRTSRDSVVLDRWGDTTSLGVIATDRLGSPVPSAAVSVVSSDTLVATIELTGSSGARVRSRRDGSTTITVAVQGTNIQGTAQVRVAIQRNMSCRIPSTPSARGAASGPVAWDAAVIANSGIPPRDSILTNSLTDTRAIDADGDGDPDVAVPWFMVDSPQRTGRTVNGMKVFRNDGGTLVDATDALWGSEPVTWSYPRVAIPLDVDGSGRKSLLLLDTGYDPASFGGCGAHAALCTGARNTLLTSSGGRLRNESARLLTNSSNSFSHAGAAADVDCDGDDDVFEGTWSNSTAREPAHLHINSAGMFQADDSRLPSDLPRTEGFVGFTFCDIDRDGDPDGVVSLYGRRPRIMVNDGFGRFRLLAPSAVPEPLGGDSRSEFAAMTCADFDGDGWNDVALGRHATLIENQAVMLLINERNGTFRDASADAATTFSAAGVGAWPWTVESTDFNGDNWPDILVTSPFAVGRILYGTGAGRFSEWVFPQNGSFFWMAAGGYPVVADFTGDRRPDIFVFRGRFDHALLRNR